MHRPRFVHLVGASSWLHCVHRGTELHGSSECVQLARRAGAVVGGPVADELARRWEQARGGLAFVECDPSDCAGGSALLADAGGAWLRLEEDGWRTLEPVLVARGEDAPDLRFRSVPGARPAPRSPRALQRDPFGRLWLLERPDDAGARARVRLLSERDLRAIDTLTPPSGAELVDLALTAWGAVGLDAAGRLWRCAYGGEWTPEDPPPPGLEGRLPVAISAALGERAFALYAAPGGDASLARVGPRGIEAAVLTGHRAPGRLLALDDERVLVGELDGEPAAAAPTLFSCYVWREGAPRYVETLGARRFDGRGLTLDRDGRPVATTPDGLRAMRPRPSRFRGTGSVETFALDSGRPATRWHRVFLDACLPEGTRVRVSARTSDEEPDPNGASQDLEEAAWARLAPDAFETPAEEEWKPLAALDRRGARADVPFPPELSDLPSDDRALRGASAEPMRNGETLEGLLPTPPGRFLWLRVELSGTRVQSPRIRALRASYDRPSLLAHLPAWWRAEPESAARTERALALFEGLATELDERIEALPALFDPRATPPEALEWLAEWVALGFDTRLREGVRRQLLLEALPLYRSRGTKPGLERALSLVAEAPVQVVEAFRMRGLRRMQREGVGSRYLGEALLGPGLRIGFEEDESGAPVPRPGWERDLGVARKNRCALPHPVAMSSRCGEDVLDPSPVVAEHRRFAHRFSVLVLARQDDTLAGLLGHVLELMKPAHTVHDICWIDAGFRVGTGTHVGVGTRFGEATRWRPGVLDRAILGRGYTLGRPAPRHHLATFVGRASGSSGAETKP